MKTGRIDPISDMWWAGLILSANQTSNFDTRVQWNGLVKSGFDSSVLDTTTNIGRITLPANKSFIISYIIRGAGTNIVEFEFSTISGTAIVSKTAAFTPVGKTYAGQLSCEGFGAVTTEEETTFDVIVNAAYTSYVTTIYRVGSAVYIRQVQGG